MRRRSEETNGPWDASAQRERFAARTETDVRIVEADDTPVGSVRLARGAGGAMWIGLIEVHPDWQGKGIGTRVIEWLDEEAARAGDAMTLRVRHGNRARGLYERLGFVVEREDDTHAYLRRE